jgi:hypothetical protein
LRQHPMTLLEFLRKHIDSLMALSYVEKDRAVSARLRELADECRLMLSIADISGLTSDLTKFHY